MAHALPQFSPSPAAVKTFLRKSSAMSKREDVRDDERDPLEPSPQVPSEIPAGLDRRKFIMRSAVVSAAAVMNGCTRSETEQKAPPPAAESAPAAAAPAVPL